MTNNASNSLKLFHTPGTRSVRALWLMEEMGLDYELVTIEYNHEYFVSEEYRAINPLGRVPALYDGEQLVIESTVIMEYVLNCYGPSELNRDSKHPEYAKFLQWLHMAESGATGYLAVVLGTRAGGPESNYAVSAGYEAYCLEHIEKVFAMLESALQGQDYLMSDGFSAADISVGYTLFLATVPTIPLQLPISEKLTQYLERLQQRDAWKKIMAIMP